MEIGKVQQTEAVAVRWPQMFAEYRKAASLLQFGSTSLKSTQISKSDSQDPDNHTNDTMPVDEECYDGSVVGGSIVWKACKD